MAANKKSTRGWETAGNNTKNRTLQELMNSLSLTDQELHRRAFLYFLGSLTSGCEVEIETLERGTWNGIYITSLITSPFFKIIIV